MQWLFHDVTSVTGQQQIVWRSVSPITSKFNEESTMMLARRSVASGSFALLSFALVVLAIAAFPGARSSERLLTASELLTNFGGANGLTCANNPNCFPAGYYTQSCSSLTPLGPDYCTQVLAYTDNANVSCQPDPDCPNNGSTCSVTGPSLICSNTYSCVKGKDQTGAYICGPGVQLASYYSQQTCLSTVCTTTPD